MLKGEEKIRMWGSLCCNAAIVVCGALGTYLHFVKYGWEMLKFYTLLSNVFVTLTAAVCLYCNARCVLGLRRYVPPWAKVLKYLSTCTVMVTMATVIFVLAPMAGGFGALRFLLFQGEMLYHHLLCPLLALISFVWVDSGGCGADRRIVRLAVVPTLLYGAVTILLNAAGVLDGPYPFLRVRAQPAGQSVLWVLAILALAYALAFAVWKLSVWCSWQNDRTPADAPPEKDGYSADGYLKNQDCLSGYAYRTIPASDNGCGPVAAYNLRLYAGQSARLTDVFSELEAMHLLNIPGPTYLYVMRRYLKKYLPDCREARGREACLAAARGSAMGVFRYSECRIPHFVSYVRTSDGAFRFFNVCDGAEDAVFPVERFVRKHCAEGMVRLLYWETRTGDRNEKEGE